MSRNVTFFFDCGCPFAWVTSRWIVEVAQHTDITVEWVPMSLAILNDGRDIPEDYRKHIEPLWRSARLFAAVKRDHPEAIADLYTAVGTRFFTEGRRDEPNVDVLLREAIAEAGLPAELCNTLDDESLNEVAADYHQQAMGKVGDDVGTPVIVVDDGAGFFGPVLTRVPRGEQAVALFEAAATLGSYPHFFELKRSRTERPQFD